MERHDRNAEHSDTPRSTRTSDPDGVDREAGSPTGFDGQRGEGPALLDGLPPPLDEDDSTPETTPTSGGADVRSLHRRDVVAPPPPMEEIFPPPPTAEAVSFSKQRRPETPPSERRKPHARPQADGQAGSSPSASCVQIARDNKVVYRRVEELREHPSAGAVPGMPEGDWSDFVQDVRARGVQTPIEILSDDTVLDGHQRLRGAREAELEFVPCVVVHLKPGEDPVEWMIRHALQRRHLNPGQKAALALRLVNIQEARAAAAERKAATQIVAGKPPARPVSPVVRGRAQPAGGRFRDEVAKAAGVSPQTAQKIITVHDKDPALLKEVESGRKSADAAAREVKKKAGGPSAVARHAKLGAAERPTGERTASTPESVSRPSRAADGAWAASFVKQTEAEAAWAWSMREKFKTALAPGELRSFAAGLRRLAKSHSRLADTFVPGVRSATKGRARNTNKRPRTRADKPFASRRTS
jgi:ParB-like chromosome segregation protein Spo0J